MKARLVDLVRSKDGKEEVIFEIPEGKEILIGREVEGADDIRIPSKEESPYSRVSRKHVALKYDEKGVLYVMDLGSKNGTLAGKENVGKKWVALKDRDSLILGNHYEFTVRYDAPKEDTGALQLAPQDGDKKVLD